MIFDLVAVTENEGASVNEPDEVDKHGHSREEHRPCTFASQPDEGRQQDEEQFTGTFTCKILASLESTST